MSENNKEIDKSDYKTVQKSIIEKNSKTVLNIINKHSKEKSEKEDKDIER